MHNLSPGRRSLFRSLIPLILIPFAPQFLHGQSSPETSNASPPKSPLPVIDQQQFLSYWTSETGWQSELQLRNNVVGHDLTVTPVLRSTDGVETTLAAVTIKSQEVRSVDLDMAISDAKASQLVGTYGSIVLRYRSSTWSSLYAAEMIHKVGHAVAFHIDATMELQAPQAGSREGIWWLPKETTNDYLILTNQGNTALSLVLSLYDSAGRESKQQLPLGPQSTTRFSVRKLLQAAGLTGLYGGIQISAAAHAGSLDTLHFLFDEDANFSALLKMFDHFPNTKLSERDFAGTGVWTLRAPMLALANPDTALAFPPGTTLQPQLFIRNTTAKPVDATLRFNWHTAAPDATGRAPGPQLHLLPYETRRVDIAALQDGTILPKQANWTSVTLTTNALPDEVTAVAASYDETLRYGAQTPFSDQLTFEWEGGMWEYDPYHSSIITAGNGGTKPTQVAFTIFYNQGTQRYDLEQTLQPDEQMWIDVGKLIREQVPDKNGNFLPNTLTSGSYQLRDLTNRAIGSLFEGKVTYDKTYGHVAYGCAECCGYADAPYMYYNPLGVALGFQSGQDVWDEDLCTDNEGSILFAISPSSWTTGNGAIATASKAVITGVAIGSTTNGASGSLTTGIGGGGGRKCPVLPVNPSGNANVTPSVSFVGGNNFIFEGTDPTVTVFNGQQVQGNPAGGSYAWSGTSTSSYNPQILFNGTASTYSTTSGTVTVTVSGALSSSLLDTTLSVIYSVDAESSKVPATKAITIRQFEYLAQNGPIQILAENGPSQYGFISTVYYNVYTHPQGQILSGDFSGISVYEQLNLGQCNFPGSNLNTGTGGLNANSEIVDDLSIIWTQPLPPNISCAADQYLGVGGFIVRHNTISWSSSGPSITNLGPTD